MTFDFPFISKQEWLDKIEADLKGKSLDSLNWELSPDLIFSPIASKEDIEVELQALQSKGDNNWYILEEIVVTNNQAAHDEAIKALEGGTTALKFIIPDSCDFNVLLKDINLNWIFIHIEGNKTVTESFLGYVSKSDFDEEDVSGAVEHERVNFEDFPLIKTYEISSNNRVSPVDELAQLLLDVCRITLDETSGSIHNGLLTVNLTNTFYLNICKLRALRLLWPLLCQGFGISKHDTPFIQAKMTFPNEAFDSDYAKIQAASQAMAAAIGGVDIIHLPPTNSIESFEFHRRIARNVSHLMQLESFIHRVEDPAAGSYYLEQMTDKLASSAWEKFKLKYEGL